MKHVVDSALNFLRQDCKFPMLNFQKIENLTLTWSVHLNFSHTFLCGVWYLSKLIRHNMPYGIFFQTTREGNWLPTLAPTLAQRVKVWWDFFTRVGKWSNGATKKEFLLSPTWYGSCIPSHVLGLCTLQETNILSHLGRRRIIDSKVPFIGDMLVSQEGNSCTLSFCWAI